MSVGSNPKIGIVKELFWLLILLSVFMLNGCAFILNS